MAEARHDAMIDFRIRHDSQKYRVGEYEFRVTGDNVLGKGGFGTVWLGTRSDTKEKVAVKQVLSNEKPATFDRREAHLLQECKHENIVKLYEHKTEHIGQHDWFFFIMEYCRKGNLDKFMKENIVRMGLGLRFIKDVTCAVEYMHNLGYVHRDIKPGNILVRDSMCCVLADLGLSRDFPGSAIEATMTAGAGTITWMAPEVLHKGSDHTTHYGRFADIFSLGLVILAIINHQRGHSLEVYTVKGKLLCHWMEEDREVTTLDDASDISVTRAVKALVLQMIKFKPDERLTIGQVRERILPIINSLKLRIEKLSEKRLGFDADWFVGMSKSGHVLLGENDCPHNLLHKFLLQDDGRFSEQWTQPLPQYVSPFCKKYFCEDQSILLQDFSSSPTRRYTATLQHVDEWSQEGELVQCLPPSRAVYRVEKEGGRKLVVREEDGSRTTLSPPPGHKWSKWLSVCETPAGLVVLDATDDGPRADHYFLSTFPPGEQPVTTRHEGYAWRMNSGVCCWEDLLLVACPASVHVHSSSGRLLQTLSHQQLQLSDYDEILAVGVSGQGLMAAVEQCSVAGVSSLVVYELSYDYKAAADEAPAEEGATAAAATASNVL